MSALDDLIARDSAPAAGNGASALDALIARDNGGESHGTTISMDGLAPDAKVAKEPTLYDAISRQVGLTARAGITGLLSLPSMAGDAANTAINLGIHGVNSLAGTNINDLRMPSEILQSGMNSAGLPQPQNLTERLVQGATSAMAGVNPSVALGSALAKSASPVASAVGSGLTASPGMQIASAAGGGAGGQGAAEMGAGTIGQLAGALLGGSATGLGALGARSALGESVAQTQARRMASALRDREQNSGSMPNQDAIKPRLKLNLDGSTTDLNAPAAAPVSPQFNQPTSAANNGMRSVQDQFDTIDLLKKVGLEDQRPASISGDRFASGIDYENAKLANPLGEVTRGQLAKEQTALKTYAGSIVHDTGGQAPSPEAIGQAIRAPMQDLSAHFDSAISRLYDAAKEKAGGMGAVDPKALNTLMGDHGFRETLLSSNDGTALLGSIDRQVKRFQGVPTPGEELPPAPNTVNSAENLRKWLNSQWSPSNSRMLGQVKQALDSDVATAGGAGVFDEARQLHALRMNTLDNPNGIGKLLTKDGPNGINQAIPDELVGSKLLTMPTNQFGHIVDTIKGLPEPLQASGQQALSEIKAELARRIYKAGDSGGTQNGASVWNAANVTRELNANKSKMALVFGQDELDKFKVLHDAGHVLQTPMAYKGAAAQGYNYLQKGVLTGLPAGGAGLGAMLGGGPLGATAGSAAGGVAAVVAKSRIDANMAQQLADLLRTPKPVFPKQ